MIAIDGPAASGKSAVGVAVATRLGFRFFDTGAMYRAVTWYALRRNIDVHDPHALATLVEHASVTVREAPRGSADATSVRVDGEDATPHLRDSPVEAHVSVVSRVPGVRRALVRIQRELASDGAVVMAGRDIGTVVLPDADCKIYLDASREVRAQRRRKQILDAGGEADYDDLLADLERRDGIDSSRPASPLTAAPDAVIINTDNLSVDEVVERIVEMAT
ncbi:MAG: (d)CMP kinase [Dehalococcoidia bacterium]